MDLSSLSPAPSDERWNPSLAAATATATATTQRQLCRLELLPPELLEKIFFHSLEINLPRASIHIAGVLSKPIIYKWLVRLAFSSPNTSSRHDFFTPDFLPPPLDYWALSVAERTHLQTVILECRWSTLQLFRQCQRDYLKQVIRQKCKDLMFSPEDQYQLDHIDRWLERPMEFDLATHGRRGSGDLLLKAKRIIATEDTSTSATTHTSSITTTPVERITASNDARDERRPSATSTDMRLAIWIHFGAMQIREPSPVLHEIDLFRLPCPPSPDVRPRMPDKLLHEPWTADKLELLLLLSQETYIDEDDHSSERSRHVLRQLIRDRDYDTFEKLLTMNVITKNYSYPQKWPVKTRHFRAALKHAEGPNDPFVRLLYQERWHLLGERERDVKDAVLKNMDVSPTRLNF